MRAMTHSPGQSEASIRPLVTNEKPGKCHHQDKTNDGFTVADLHQQIIKWFKCYNHLLS